MYRTRLRGQHVSKLSSLLRISSSWGRRVGYARSVLIQVRVVALAMLADILNILTLNCRGLRFIQESSSLEVCLFVRALNVKRHRSLEGPMPPEHLHLLKVGHRGKKKPALQSCCMRERRERCEEGGRREEREEVTAKQKQVLKQIFSGCWAGQLTPTYTRPAEGGEEGGEGGPTRTWQGELHNRIHRHRASPRRSP